MKMRLDGLPCIGRPKRRTGRAGWSLNFQAIEIIVCSKAWMLFGLPWFGETGTLVTKITRARMQLNSGEETGLFRTYRRTRNLAL